MDKAIAKVTSEFSLLFPHFIFLYCFVLNYKNILCTNSTKGPVQKTDGKGHDKGAPHKKNNLNSCWCSQSSSDSPL